MLTDRTSEGSDGHVLLDRAVLNLMLDAERQRPLSEDEIARALNVPGDIRESCSRGTDVRADRRAGRSQRRASPPAAQNALPSRRKATRCKKATAAAAKMRRQASAGTPLR